MVLSKVFIMAKRGKKPSAKAGKAKKAAAIDRMQKAGFARKDGVCPECGYSKFYEDDSRGERTCAKCGLVLEESLVDSSQEWRAFDEEQRSKRARTGAPLTFSVDYKEPIVIKEGDEIRVVKIGEFVDSVMERNKDNIEKQGILETLKLPENKYFAVSFDRENNIDFKPVSEVSRHAADSVYEIEIESGNKIMVTGSHSLFSAADNKIVPIKVDNLKKGDFVAGPKTLPLDGISRKIMEELGINGKIYNELLLKNAEHSFNFFAVKNIKKTKPSNGYAYDLSVPDCENFAGKIFYHNTKHDKGITTEIGKGAGELFKVPSRKRAQYYRLTKWQKRLIESKDRNLSFALSELQRLISFLGLHRGVHEAVAKKYEQAVDRGLVRGRSMESVIAALLYAICRETGTPRTLEEIAEASGVEKREIGRTYRYISRELGIKILPALPEHYVPRFCSMLGLTDKTQARSIQILKKAKEHDVTSGKGPTGVAAAALYIAAVLNGERKTQREIADAVGVTEVTIRNRFKEIIDKLGITEEVEKKVKEGEMG